MGMLVPALLSFGLSLLSLPSVRLLAVFGYGESGGM
jgi:hypothetical protein